LCREASSAIALTTPNKDADAAAAGQHPATPAFTAARVLSNSASLPCGVQMPTLPTAFIAIQGSRVRLDGGTLVIEHPDPPGSLAGSGSAAKPTSHTTLQLGHLGAVVALGRVDFTSAALAALAERGIGCVLASQNARMRASIVAPCARHVALRSLQHALEAERSSNPSAPRPMQLARFSIRAKLDALIGILAQHHRTHADVDLGQPIAQIRSLRARAEHADSIDRLRGFEGASMASYFATMPALCRGELKTSARTRRPPQDEINAALSFGYSLLVNELTCTLHARGLDPALGVMHPPADGRPSLALDLVEPLRHAIIDRLVLRAVNRRELTAADFEGYTDEGSEGRAGVRMTDAGRGRFLQLYQAAMGAGCSDACVGAAAPRTARSLLADLVEEYERALTGANADLSNSAPDAVETACDSTNSNSTSISPSPPPSTATAS
jgi:CRISP-associated protein Cas1